MSSIQGIPQNQVKEPLAFIRKAQVFIYLIFFLRLDMELYLKVTCI